MILKTPADIERYKEVTEEQRKAIEAADALWVKPPQVFIDLWNQACVVPKGSAYSTETIGGYNKQTGFFELNGLTDITYEQALRIYHFTSNWQLPTTMQSLLMQCQGVRTNFPQREMNVCDVTYPFYYSYDLEVINGHNIRFAGGLHVNRAPLHTIKDLAGMKRTTVVQINASELVDVSYQGNVDCPEVSFYQCSKLSAQAVMNTVDAGTATLKTITLHSDVYAKLTGGGEDWSDVFRQAQEKGITFASA